MKKLIIGLVAVFSSGLAVASGRTFTWQGTSESSWTDPSSYKEATADDLPGKGDIVILPNAMTARVDKASADFVSALTNICPQGAASCLIVDSDDDLKLGCAFNNGFTYQPTGRGVMLKRGSGSLILGSSGQAMLYSTAVDYYVDIVIENGAVTWPAESGFGMYAQTVTLGIGCTMNLIPGKTVTVTRLWGCGDIENPGTALANFAIGVPSIANNGHCEFAGRINGLISIFASSGECCLTGTDSSFNSAVNVQNGGLLAFKTVGPHAGVNSSLGRSAIHTRDGHGRLLYLGEGAETTIKEFTFWDSSTGPNVFDAGAYGGITFNGAWKLWSAKLGTRRLVLTGSNETACVFNNAWPAFTNATGKVCSFFIRKQGSGTWRFNDNSGRCNSGVLAVDEGTVEFTSVSNAGEVCSLGLSNELYPDVDGEPDPAAKLPYAFLLGCGSAVGTLKYCGTSYSQTTNRPLALAGDGRLCQTATGGNLKWCGVSAAEPGLKHLILAGESPSEVNTVWNVSDGEGTVAVVKEGSGVWTVDGIHGFTGGIDVRGGDLEINNYEHYTWYKLVLKSNWHAHETYGADVKGFEMQEFALYDEKGVRQNVGLDFQLQDHLNLTNNSSAYVRQGTPYAGFLTSRGANYLFDDEKTAAGCYVLYMRDDDASQQLQSETDHPETWLPIAFRLGRDSSPCVRWDIAGVSGPSTNPTLYSRNPRDYAIEASVDGLRWHVLTNVFDSGIAISGRWLYDRAEFASGHVRPGAGYQIESSPQGRRSELLKPQSVKVSKGAELHVNGTSLVANQIVLDAAAGEMGKMINVNLDSTGTLVVENAAVGTKIRISADLTQVGNLDNVADWSVICNGKGRSGWQVHADESGFTLIPPGMVLIVR